MKEVLVQEIYNKFVSMGFSPVLGGEADISIEEPALNVKLGFTPKRMSFEAFVLVNEPDKAIYFFERANDNGSSFAANAGAASGSKSLPRKVRGSFVDGEGKKVSYDFDLNDFPKIMRTIAETHGYVARKVTRKASAQFQ
ncbi:MAG: hypothetical protein WCO08_06930 [Actinomycetes bacterium]